MTTLISIDLELGQMRVYVSVAGAPPKKVYRFDLENYTRDTEWDLNSFAQFFKDPLGFLRENGITPPEAA